MRHILLMQGNVDAALLPKQFYDRLLITGVPPIVPNLPGISAQVVGTRWTGLNARAASAAPDCENICFIVSISRRATRGDDT